MAQSRARATTIKKKTAPKAVKKPTRLFYVFLAISLLYIVVSMIAPVDKAQLAKYNVSEAKTHLLNLTIVIPLTAVWLSAFYGYSRIRQYANAVKSSDEGPALGQISHGLGWLAFSLPLNSLLSAALNGLAVNHPSYLVPFTIIRNYAALILPLVAFTLICRGCALLTTHVKQKKQRLFSQELWSAGIIMMCSLFTWLMIARPADTRTPLNVYQLPNWLIIMTLTVPYLYMWTRGIASAYYIMVYQRNVKGQLYRTSLRRLSAGFMVVIMLNILIQVIVSVSARLTRLNLTPLLLIVYVLIAFYAVGFGLIASGAKKLKRIEEV